MYYQTLFSMEFPKITNSLFTFLSLHFSFNMQPTSPPTNLLQKYFPDLCTPSTTREDFFYSDFSVSAFSSAILQTTHVGKTQVFVISDLFSKISDAHFNGRFSRGHLSVANVGQLETLEAFSWCRIEVKEEEGEKYYKGKVVMKGKDSRGRNSWSELPKFLLAGAVSTIVSRSLSLSLSPQFNVCSGTHSI